MKHYLFAALALSLAACASQELPTSGTPSQFDGLWAGEATSTNGGCPELRIDGEVRFGAFLATIYSGSTSRGQVWGNLDASGEVDGSIGASGVRAGESRVKFGDTTAEGTWKANNCSGTLELTKQG